MSFQGFSLQQAYNAAADGAVITVPDDATIIADSGDTAELYGGSKRVTFQGSRNAVCQAGTVQVFADNITIRGLKLRSLRVGLGGDPRGIKGFLGEDLKLDGVEVVGGEATLRRCEIGPNVGGFAWTDTSVPAYARLRPDSPWEVERFWAYRGGGDGFQPYFHVNGAGVNAKVLLERCWIHDIQSRDSERWHSGGMLIWNNGAPATDQVVIRECRIENVCHLGILVDGGHGIVLERSVVGPVVEPLDNIGQDLGRHPTIAPAYAKDFGPRTDPNTNTSWRPSNYRVVGCTLYNGLGLDSAMMDGFANTVVDRNYLGRESVCWPGATYGGNMPAVCGSMSLASLPPLPTGGPWEGTSPPPPPPEPPPPPPPDPVYSLPLTKLSETQTTITFGWTPVEGCIGYRFSADGVRKSHTWDSARSNVKFAKGSGVYKVEALMPGPWGEYRG